MRISAWNVIKLRMYIAIKAVPSSQGQLMRIIAPEHLLTTLLQ